MELYAEAVFDSYRERAISCQAIKLSSREDLQSSLFIAGFLIQIQKLTAKKYRSKIFS